MKHFRGEKRFYYGMTVLVLVFIIAGLTSNLEGGVRGNRQEKEAFDHHVALFKNIIEYVAD